VKTLFPLREWGWDIKKVNSYLKEKNITIPKRTDCSLCFYQKISEWFYLWRDNREFFNKGIAFEKKTGHTFRNPNKKRWGASLEKMSTIFQSGKVPRKATNQLPLFDEEMISCRVCRL